MHVYLLSRPRRPSAWMPSGAVGSLARGLASLGVEVTSDVRPAEAAPPRTRTPDASTGFRSAVAACAAELRERWRDDAPDIVHAFGYVASLAAVRESNGRFPVVGTFYQSPPWEGLERWLARRLDGLVVASTSERERWRQAGLPTDDVRVVSPCIDDVTAAGPARPSDDRTVVTDANGPELSALVASMRFWGEPARLVVLGCDSARRIAAVSSQAEDIGVLDRLEWRSSAQDSVVAAPLTRARLAVAFGSARHGALVTQAAAHGIPSVAVDHDAHSDLVVSRATGLLVAYGPSPVLLGEAVRHVLADPMVGDGYGEAAQARVRAVQSPARVADLIVRAYGDTLERAGHRRPTQGTDTGRPETDVDETTRDQLVTEYLPLAYQLASRYRGRGQPMDDLVQVASLGLVKAASRYDPSHGTAFAAFAVPTILGEIRRHFRDHAWAVRVPRTLQETTLRVDQATQRIGQTNGAEASTEQLAAELGLTDVQVVEARQTRREAFSQTSLDHPVGEDGDACLGDLIGTEDPSFEHIERQVAVRTALQKLPDRERQILTMRFFGDKTQSEIAAYLGLSQVHVSRTLSRVLTLLREHVLDETPLPSSWGARDSN